MSITKNGKRRGVHRRELLAGAAYLVFGASHAGATIISGQLPWTPDAGSPPAGAQPGPWVFFTAEEGRTLEALADRIIPADPETPGGKEAGCAVFVDRQLAGPYGRQDGLYLKPPFQKGSRTQGHQAAEGPAQDYRVGLAALNRACKAEHGKPFFDLSDADKDRVMSALETGDLGIEGTDGRTFFAQVVRDVQMGFFADPIYGGNRDMVAWKMIGYPGARYNYLDWVSRHNEKFPLPPVSMTGRAEWTRSER